MADSITDQDMLKRLADRMSEAGSAEEFDKRARTRRRARRRQLAVEIADRLAESAFDEPKTARAAAATSPGEQHWPDRGDRETRGRNETSGLST